MRKNRQIKTNNEKKTNEKKLSKLQTVNSKQTKVKQQPLSCTRHKEADITCTNTSAKKNRQMSSPNAQNFQNNKLYHRVRISEQIT